MLFKSVFTAALVATAMAAPLQDHHHHKHNENKRDVVTATNVVYVTVNGGSSPVTTAAAAATAGAQKAVEVSSSAPAEASSTEASFTEASSSAAASSSDSSSSASSSASSSGSNGSSGAKGVTYSPYSNDGGCKSSSQISSEIAQLSGFDVIRLYGVDCNQVEAVLSSKASGQKVFAGIFDVSNIESGVQSLASAVKSAGSWDDIHTVSIGNELVNGGQANPDQIGKYVNAGRSALKAAGYTGPVVSVDTFIAVINNPDLCSHSDYMAVNAHAFFDGGVDASGSGKWLLEQIQRVSSACGNSKKVMITESGWPSKGDSNNKAVPSKQNQESAISSIKSSCGNDVILFTAFNDLWKADGAYNAEKYWGILSN